MCVGGGGGGGTRKGGGVHYVLFDFEPMGVVGGEGLKALSSRSSL